MNVIIQLAPSFALAIKALLYQIIRKHAKVRGIFKNNSVSSTVTKRKTYLKHY